MYSLVKKSIDWVKEYLEYYKLEPHNCDVSNLCSFNKKDLDNIFNSEEIHNKWKNVKNQISLLELPDFTGGVNKGDQRAIYYLVKGLKAKSILEIGTHIGCSTVHFALALNEFKVKKLITIDILDVNNKNEQNWKKYKSKYSPKELLSKIECSDFVHFKKIDSIEFMKNCKNKFDLIFLDGSHEAKNVCQELPIALKLINKGGAILLHDFFPNNKPLWPNNSPISGPYIATKKLISKNKNFLILPLGNLPWQTKLNSNVTSLAVTSAIK